MGAAFYSFRGVSAGDFWASPEHSPLHKRRKVRIREVREGRLTLNNDRRSPIACDTRETGSGDSRMS